MTFIIISSSVPDLASQIELVTAFTSEYMQEGEDGCEISRTYLSLIACFRYLESLDVVEGMERQRDPSIAQNNFVVNSSIQRTSTIAMLGLSQFLLTT